MPSVELDMLGIVCPDFGYALRAFMRRDDVPAGSELVIKADAHNAVRDVKALCEFGGHSMLSVHSEAGATVFLLKKGS